MRVSTVKPLVTKMVFTCERCGTQIHTWFRDGKFSYPSKCANNGCRAKTYFVCFVSHVALLPTHKAPTRFKPDFTNASVVDWQKIRLQEQSMDDARDEGRVPRTIECELTEVCSVMHGMWRATALIRLVCACA